MTRRRTPVYILTGFLGAGKTTLLKHLLRHEQAQGKRAAVLMNEFGAVSVDSALLQDALVPVVDLVEGCVCCSVRGSLTEGLEQLLDQHTPDVVFLEATGVAMPVEIVDALLDLPLSGRVEVAGVLTCVDATQFPLHLPEPYMRSELQETMVEQVTYADVLLLTKTDEAAFDRVFALESLLRGMNQEALLVRAVQGRVDFAKVLGVRRRTGGARKKVRKLTRMSRGATGPVTAQIRPVLARTSYGKLQTFHYEFRRDVDAEALYELLTRLPDTVLRAKGIFRDAMLGKMLQFHYVPGRPVMDIAEWLEGIEPFAVFIGEDITEPELRRALAACETER